MTKYELIETGFMAMFTALSLFWSVILVAKQRRKKKIVDSSITLEENDFRDLVRGKIVEYSENSKIQICLEDIGFDRMIEIIQEEKINQE